MSNQYGHPMIKAEINALNVYTNSNWDCSLNNGKTWNNSKTADEKPYLNINRQFKRADIAFKSNIGYYAVIFIIFYLILYYSNQTLMAQSIFSGKNIRFLLLFLWIILALNNIFKIPLSFGMDIKGHLLYIIFIAKNHILPIFDSGWQTFQAPLYYIVSSILYNSLRILFSEQLSFYLLRIIPLFCGLFQIEICFRIIKTIYPTRNDLQAIGSLFGGFLAMNIYISQVLGNESFTMLWGGLCILFICKLLKEKQLRKQYILLIGVFAGMAVITKISALLFIIPTCIITIYTGFTKNESCLLRNYTKSILKSLVCLLIFLFGIFLTSGWYFIYNFIFYRKLLLFNNITWWQDPGYRTISQIFSFGNSLFYPIYSSIYSFTDGFYSTFWLDGNLSGTFSGPMLTLWNINFMIAGAWLSIIPTMLIVLGIFHSLYKVNIKDEKYNYTAMMFVAIYIAAIFYLFLLLPIYATVKASYACAIIPCFAILLVNGIKVFDKLYFVKILLWGILVCWAINNYLSFFVIK